MNGECVLIMLSCPHATWYQISHLSHHSAPSPPPSATGLKSHPTEGGHLPTLHCLLLQMGFWRDGSKGAKVIPGTLGCSEKSFGISFFRGFWSERSNTPHHSDTPPPPPPLEGVKMGIKLVSILLEEHGY